RRRPGQLDASEGARWLRLVRWRPVSEHRVRGARTAGVADLGALHSRGHSDAGDAAEPRPPGRRRRRRRSRRQRAGRVVGGGRRGGRRRGNRPARCAAATRWLRRRDPARLRVQRRPAGDRVTDCSGQDGRVTDSEPRDPVADLRDIAYLLERTGAATPRVKAFRNAAAVAESLGVDELHDRIEANTLTKVSGIGDSTATAITESLAGKRPSYFAKIEADLPAEAPAGPMRKALRGDLHMHSDWSDGGSPIEEMMQAARDLGHEYVALTDH